MNLGEHLKHERELRKVSLHEIADITKISVQNLNVIESFELDKLPSRVFAKGFIKSYANCMGLDVSDIMRRYELETLRPQNGQISSVQQKSGRPRKVIKIKVSGKVVFAIVAVIIIALAAFFSSR